ncbi:MAG: hypothetical protein IT422_03795 [Pirellulaceae bacterium]|jgi:hypothetical protein|nr:hypothetical protein [Pirellulaceae bacterium]
MIRRYVSVRSGLVALALVRLPLGQLLPHWHSRPGPPVHLGCMASREQGAEMTRGDAVIVVCPSHWVTGEYRPRLIEVDIGRTSQPNLSSIRMTATKFLGF